MNITAEVFGISRHRFNIDGKGITTLVSMMRCPLLCKYCINRECHYSQANMKEKNFRTRKFTAKELYDAVKIDHLYFLATGGGITFGGGEPGYYDVFIQHFKSICEPNWKINIETSLNFPTENMSNLINVIDSFIIDIKDMSPLIYRKYTSMSNELVYENLRILKDSGKIDNVKIRVPHIPEFNTPSDVYNSIYIIRRMGFKTIEEFTYVLPNKLHKYEKR